MEVVKTEKARDVGGVFHCYSGSVEMARDVLNNNFERPANDEEDWVWCYLLINFNKDANSFSKEVYYVGQKNAQNFDLNILRKDFTYICKLTCYATL